MGMVVRPPTGGHYLHYRFFWLLLSDLCYELLPFFFTPNQVIVEHKMANATSFIFFLIFFCKSKLKRLFNPELNARRAKRNYVKKRKDKKRKERKIKGREKEAYAKLGKAKQRGRE